MYIVFISVFDVSIRGWPSNFGYMKRCGQRDTDKQLIPLNFTYTLSVFSFVFVLRILNDWLAEIIVHSEFYLETTIPHKKVIIN